MEEKMGTGTHGFSLQDRKKGRFTGVNDVISFDPGEILLKTQCGMLQIKGKELHVNRLDLQKGEVDIDGQVDALGYSKAPGAKKGSMLGKLFG